MTDDILANETPQEPTGLDAPPERPKRPLRKPTHGKGWLAPAGGVPAQRSTDLRVKGPGRRRHFLAKELAALVAGGGRKLTIVEKTTIDTLCDLSESITEARAALELHPKPGKARKARQWNLMILLTRQQQGYKALGLTR